MTHNILITGASGYLGSVVLQKLHTLAQTKKNIGTLVAMDIRVSSNRLENVIYLQQDIRDGHLANVLLQHKITTVLHLAAVLDSNSLPRQTQYEIDVLGTKNVVESCIAAGVQRFIVTSSGAAYGYYEDNPEWLTESDNIRGNEVFPYASHKRQVEELLAQYRKSNPQLEQTIFRVCTILGASTNNLITKLFERKSIVGIRGCTSPYVFVWDEDVANCLVQAIFSEKTGIYNLSGDGAISNRTLAKLLGKKYLNLPAFVLRNGLRVARALGLTQYGADQVLFIQYRPVMDNHKLKTEFGFQPEKTSLETFLYFLQQRGLAAQSIEQTEILYPLTSA